MAERSSQHSHYTHAPLTGTDRGKGYQERLLTEAHTTVRIQTGSVRGADTNAEQLPVLFPTVGGKKEKPV